MEGNKRIHKNKEERVYPFGIDPIWGEVNNGMTFMNSLRMKLAIIFGVLHMSLGLGIKLLNGIHFRRFYEVYIETIPQMIFLFVVFGYLAILIIVKWCIGNRCVCFVRCFFSSFSQIFFY